MWITGVRGAGCSQQQYGALLVVDPGERALVDWEGVRCLSYRSDHPERR